MKKRMFSALLALAMCLALLPATASAAERNLPDWYFLFAIFKNVDADGKDRSGVAAHIAHSITQDEVDTIKAQAQAFEDYMTQTGVMRAHVDVVEIDATLTELHNRDGNSSFIGAAQAAPLLEGKVDLDRYDHVACIFSTDIRTGYLGISSSPFENGTGHSCINLMAWEQQQAITGHPPEGLYTHEYLHFMERMSKKWGVHFDVHGIEEEFYGSDQVTWLDDLIRNRAKGNAGTGVAPFVWQYPPHVLRTTTELTIPSSVTSIGDRAFWGVSDHFTRVFIPTSVTSIGYAAFWDTGVKDVYYSGTEAQWKAIQFGEFSAPLTKANIHYNHLMADVTTNAWYAKPVTWALENSVASGTGSGNFSPSKNCTVAEILTFLYQAYGAPAVSGNPYSNVKSSDWYANAAIWAHDEGLVTGKTFNASTPCTRSMAVDYLWKLAGSPEAKAASFDDVPADAGYAKAVNWAVEQGVTAGVKENQFGPSVVCTRSQIVTFLYSALAK